MKNCILIPLVFLLLQSCAAYHQLMVAPTGEIVDCASAGYGLIGAVTATANRDQCVESLLSAGYLRIEDAGVIGIELREDDSLVILKVIPGSPAAKGGIKPGDKINKIDNVLITTKLDARKMLFGKAGTWVNVEVQRGKGYYSKTMMRFAHTLVYGSN